MRPSLTKFMKLEKPRGAIIKKSDAKIETNVAAGETPPAGGAPESPREHPAEEKETVIVSPELKFPKLSAAAERKQVEEARLQRELAGVKSFADLLERLPGLMGVWGSHGKYTSAKLDKMITAIESHIQQPEADEDNLEPFIKLFPTNYLKELVRKLSQEALLRKKISETDIPKIEKKQASKQKTAPLEKAKKALTDAGVDFPELLAAAPAMRFFWKLKNSFTKRGRNINQLLKDYKSAEEADYLSKLRASKPEKTQ